MFVPLLTIYAGLTAIVLLWARFSKLDLGLRRPTLAGVLPWILLYLLSSAIGWAIWEMPVGTASDWTEEEWFSLWEDIAIAVVISPIFEELLFRGALFSALLRRWGIVAAAVVPSIVWSLLHIQHDAGFIVFLIGSGMALAIIRWKSGSLLIPLGLHIAYNLLAALDAHRLIALPA